MKLFFMIPAWNLTQFTKLEIRLKKNYLNLVLNILNYDQKKLLNI